MLLAIHFFEKNIPVLSQCLNRVPEIDENIKIKGRKGKNNWIYFHKLMKNNIFLLNL